MQTIGIIDIFSTGSIFNTIDLQHDIHYADFVNHDQIIILE